MKPLLEVVRGEPTADELAALVTVIAARAARAETAAAAETSGWADPATRLRKPHRHGPGAWRWSQR